MFNEYVVYQMIKIRQEEIEKKAQNDWKYRELQKETFFQKVAKKWKKSKKANRFQTNCCCECGC